MNDFQKQLYNASLTTAINQSKLSLKPIKLQLNAINNLYKNTFTQLDFTKLLENISQQLNETSNLAQAFPSKALNNLISVQMNQLQIQNKINTMIKESLILSTKALTSELDKLNKTLSIAISYLPENVIEKLQEALITSKSDIPKDIQEEIELGFENQIKENNEILNNPFLDKEVVKNMVLNRNICFFITVFSIITPLITDKVTYQVVSNVIAYIYSELVRKYNIDKRNM